MSRSIRVHPLCTAIAFVLLGPAALAAPAELQSEGSSGKYFAAQEEACSAAQADATSAAQGECGQKNGEAGEATASDCTCEEGGFEGKEWLCSATATLTCEIADAPAEEPAPAPVEEAELLEFAAPTTLTPLEMLSRDFNRRGLTLPRASMADRYTAMCEKGWSLACDASTWLTPGISEVKEASTAILNACADGDEAACVAEGWYHEAQAAESGEANEYRAAARRYKALCDEKKNQRACYEYGVILFNNLGVEADYRLGVRRWEKACDGKDPAACTALARIHAEGAQVKPDPAKAKQYAKKACNLGDPLGCLEQAKLTGDPKAVTEALQYTCSVGGVSACWELAQSYLNGQRPDPGRAALRNVLQMGCELGNRVSCSSAASSALSDGDDVEAARLYRNACREGDVNSCSGLVDLIIGERTAGSIKEDQYAFEVSCSRAGNAAACSKLGLALLEGESIKKDAARARALLKQSCIDKTSPARTCFVLGDLYESGAGGERDRTLASTYYKWACEQGWGEACDRRGDLLDQGVGVREDDAEAVASFQQGCDAGFPAACYKAGIILDEGTNIPRDAKRAMGLYVTACEKGVGDACLMLGKLYVEGAAGTQDDGKAREAFEKAVALNNIEAHRRLARLLWHGLGGKKDKKRAKELCGIGCRNDDPIACRGPDWQRAGD